MIRVKGTGFRLSIVMVMPENWIRSLSARWEKRGKQKKRKIRKRRDVTFFIGYR